MRNNAEVQKFDAQIKTDHKDEFEKLQKINKAKSQLTEVQTSAKSVKDVNNKTQVQISRLSLKRRTRY